MFNLIISLFFHPMKIISFNINGINSYCNYIKTKYNCVLNDYLKDTLQVDILCVQEIRSSHKKMLEYSSMKDYYIVYYNLNKGRNGIYGVSTFVRKNLYCRRHNIEVPYSDNGRTILTDHGNFKILNVYFPFYDGSSSKNREDVISFYKDIKAFMDNFDDLIVLGDFNSVYSIMDHYMFYNEFKKICNRKLTKQNLQEDNDVKVENFLKEDEILKLNEQISDYNNKVKNICKNVYEDRNTLFVENNIEKGDLRKVCLPLYKCKNIFFFNFLYRKSKYLDFLSSILRKMPYIKITEDDALRNFLFIDNEKEFNFNYEPLLVEKSYSSNTELPYLFTSFEDLTYVLFQTYQRLWFLKLILELKYIDSFRLFHDSFERYTCWNTFFNLRPKNLGTRIDYILIPANFIELASYAGILDHIEGSDHCPVFIDIDLKIIEDNKNILRVRNSLLDYLSSKK